MTTRQHPSDQLLNRLNWTVLRPLGRALGGHERSLVFGPGAELEEMREYRPGDDARAIDWPVMARTGHPYVRLANRERALDLWLVMDVSRSLNWGTTQLLKSERAIEVAYVIGSILGHFGNRVGALMFAEMPLNFIRPATGRKHLLRVIDAIDHAAGAVATAQALRPPRSTPTGPTNLEAALQRAFMAIDHKALVFVMSDFLTPSDWQRRMRQLSQKHEVIGVQIYDPRERELPDTGVMTFEDPETGRQLTVNTHDAGLRQRFAEKAAAQAETIRHDLIANGAAHFAISTSDDLLKSILRFLKSRRGRA